MTESIGSAPGAHAGVYSLTCRPTRRTYLGCSADLVSAIDTDRARLKDHRHPVRLLQADWDAHGESAFDVVVHDELVPTGPEDVCAERLQALRDLWSDQLGLDEGSSY